MEPVTRVRGQMNTAPAALASMERLTGIGTLVSAAENLANWRSFQDAEMLSWRVARTRHRWLSGKVGDVVGVAMSPPGIFGVFAGRVAAAATLVVPGVPNLAKGSASAYLAVTAGALHLRTPYGSDGSEHMSTISSTCQALARAFGRDRKAQEWILRFVAAQSALSYAAAGFAKLVSPVWRNGTAVRDITRTRMYGHRLTHSLLTRFPFLSKLLSRTTIVGELAFPAVFIAPKPVARLLLGVASSFHLGNAVVMGLNRFVPAFLGTYPAIAHCARHLSTPGVTSR